MSGEMEECVSGNTASEEALDEDKAVPSTAETGNVVTSSEGVPMSPTVDESDEVPALPSRRFSRKLHNKRNWTSEDSYEADREVARCADPTEKILWAAEKNEQDLLRELLQRDSTLVNVTDSDGYTPLHRACYNNNTEVIELLLSYDAKVDATTLDGWQPLHCASKWDSVDAAAMLLASGADVNAKTNGNCTPLHLAAANPTARQTLELLLWHPKLDPTIKNNQGDTAWDCAHRTGPFVRLFEIVDPHINIY